MWCINSNIVSVLWRDFPLSVTDILRGFIPIFKVLFIFKVIAELFSLFVPAF